MYIVCKHHYISYNNLAPLSYPLSPHPTPATPCGVQCKENRLCVLKPQMFSVLSKHQAPVKTQPTQRPGRTVICISYRSAA